MEESRQPTRVSSALIAVNALIFVLALLWQQTHGGTSWWGLGSATLLRAGASVSLEWGWADGWRLWSSVFLHLSWLHLALNMYCLTRLNVMEQALGWQRFAVLYGLSGLGGSLLSSAIDQSFVLSAGASGALFGLFGAAAVVTSGELRRSLLFTILANAIFGLSLAGINNWAHLGGLLTGIVCIQVLRYRPHSRAYAAILGLFAVLSLWSLVRVIAPRQWDDYPLRKYTLLGGKLELQLPLFFKEVTDENGTSLRSPGVVVACNSGAFAGIYPEPAGKWSVLPADEKHPQVRSAVLCLGHSYWRMDLWSAMSPEQRLKEVLSHATLDGDTSALAERARRFQLGKLSSSDLSSPVQWGDLMLLAETQLKENNPKAADATAGLALKASADDEQKWASLILEIRALEGLNQWKQALAPARQLVQLKPKSADSYNGLAWVLVHNKQFAEARAQSERAMELAPNQPMILDTYASALLGAGEAKQALEVLQQAEKLNPSVYSARRLGEAWLALGDRGKAQQAFQLAAGRTKSGRSR
jgi:membrane associated rhomboid family serine protease/tetratricopeptide (TPR) repeat protein